MYTYSGYQECECDIVHYVYALIMLDQHCVSVTLYVCTQSAGLALWECGMVCVLSKCAGLELCECDMVCVQ